MPVALCRVQNEHRTPLFCEILAPAGVPLLKQPFVCVCHRKSAIFCSGSDRHNIACGLPKISSAKTRSRPSGCGRRCSRRTMYFGRTSVTITAMAAVDMALWDLKGKHFGEPIHRLLGGKAARTNQAYASILFGRDGRETADIGRRWREAGYRAVKFGWEPMGPARPSTSTWCAGARGTRRRRHAADRCRLCLGRATAAARAHVFADFGIEWLEEPLRQDDTTAMSGCAIARPCRSPPARVSAAARRSAPDRSSRARRLPGRLLAATASPTRRTSGPSRRNRRPALQPLLHEPLTVAASLHWLRTCRDAFLFEDCVEDSPLRHELTSKKCRRSTAGSRSPTARPGRDA